VSFLKHNNYLSDLGGISMAFNPAAYKAPVAKKLPVVLLLDVSGSMDGEKINTLYDCVVDMIESFVNQKMKETIIDVAIITFGAEVKLHSPCSDSQPYVPVSDLQAHGISRFCANGMTPMGIALRMVKDLIEDKSFTPSNIYRPAVLLLSDGQPTDSWSVPLDNFIKSGRSAKCQRFAIPIGKDADRNVLRKFTGDDNNIFFAENAADIADAFQKFTMSVSMRAASHNPNAVPKVSNAPFDNNGTQDSDDDDEYI
jgi:uncharacterized protein YegL